MTTPIDFPCSTNEQIGSGYTLGSGDGEVTLEPSGLVVQNGTLYMASDNGYLVSMDVSDGADLDTSWTQVHNFTNDDGYSDNKDSYDLESITVADGKLMIGVEGRGKTDTKAQYNPHVIRYDATRGPTGSTWEITDVTLSGGGMEAMTFVPGAACPAQGTAGYYGGDQAYGGYFFAAYQSKTGYVYVYDLPKGGTQLNTVSTHLKKFELVDADGNTITQKASDMCFADDYLFILFDDGNGAKSEIHVFSIRDDGTGLDHEGASYLPSLTGWTKQSDFEGIAIDGSNMYLSVDAAGSTNTKLVVRFTDYSITDFVPSAT